MCFLCSFCRLRQDSYIPRNVPYEQVVIMLDLLHVQSASPTALHSPINVSGAILAHQLRLNIWCLRASLRSLLSRLCGRHVTDEKEELHTRSTAVAVRLFLGAHNRQVKNAPDPPLRVLSGKGLSSRSADEEMKHRERRYCRHIASAIQTCLPLHGRLLDT